MERLETGEALQSGSSFQWGEQIVWEGRRGLRLFSRRFGLWGWCILLSLLLGIVALVAQAYFEESAGKLQGRLMDDRFKEVSPAPGDSRETVDAQAESRIRLRIFEDHLLPHDDIPVVIQDLLNLAEEEGLTLLRGEYRPQVDPVGGFLRYKMTLPLKGDAVAIYRFIRLALLQQKNLALESVQFKRERIDSSHIEASIHWVILTRLPGMDRGSDSGERTHQEVAL